MLYKDLKDSDLVKLLEDASKKQTSFVERDSKMLTEMNNALNWIITLLTVLLAMSLNVFKNVVPCGLESQLLFVSKIIFCIGILNLIAHKIVLVAYERRKYHYLNMLQTHELELKYNFKAFRLKFDDNREIFKIPAFLNDFKEGKYIPFPSHDERPMGLAKVNKQIALLGLMIKITFYMSITLLLTNLSIIMYLLLK